MKVRSNIPKGTHKAVSLTDLSVRDVFQDRGGFSFVPSTESLTIKLPVAPLGKAVRGMVALHKPIWPAHRFKLAF